MTGSIGDDAAHSGDELARLYTERFDERDMAQKRLVWDTLCAAFFQGYVPTDATVLDLGAGSCEFINSIAAGRKLAVDLNPDTKRHAAADVEVLACSSTNLASVDSGSVDVVFSSNFFEHLPTKDALFATLREARRVLTAGGTLIVLMPNLRYLPGRYWDYFDHHIPLTHLSLVEALHLSGFRAQQVIPKFLPYTVKDAPVRVSPSVIHAYLRLRPAWRVLGRQMLVVARPAAD